MKQEISKVVQIIYSKFEVTCIKFRPVIKIKFMQLKWLINFDVLKYLHSSKRSNFKPEFETMNGAMKHWKSLETTKLSVSIWFQWRKVPMAKQSSISKNFRQKGWFSFSCRATTSSAWGLWWPNTFSVIILSSVDSTAGSSTVFPPALTLLLFHSMRLLARGARGSSSWAKRNLPLCFLYECA
jgi:hypothetical protein